MKQLRAWTFGNRPDLSKRIVHSGKFYAADFSVWDIIMGYDFMVGNAIGALTHPATLVGEDKERERFIVFSGLCF